MKFGLLFFLAPAMLLFSFAATAEPTITHAPVQTEGVYQIETWQDLLWISQNPEHWNKDYVQTNDIDFSNANPAIDTWNNGEGWSPIGTYSDRDESEGAFAGNYDGGGYAIKNLYIDRPYDRFIGLFGFVNESSIINVRLVDADIIGGEFVGGISGSLWGQVSNCFVSGNINGDTGIGGITGDDRDSFIITHCFLIMIKRSAWELRLNYSIWVPWAKPLRR